MKTIFTMLIFSFFTLWMDSCGTFVGNPKDNDPKAASVVFPTLELDLAEIEKEDSLNLLVAKPIDVTMFYYGVQLRRMIRNINSLMSLLTNDGYVQTGTYEGVGPDKEYTAKLLLDGDWVRFTLCKDSEPKLRVEWPQDGTQLDLTIDFEVNVEKEERAKFLSKIRLVKDDELSTIKVSSRGQPWGVNQEDAAYKYVQENVEVVVRPERERILKAFTSWTTEENGGGENLIPTHYLLGRVQSADDVEFIAHNAFRPVLCPAGERQRFQTLFKDGINADSENPACFGGDLAANRLYSEVERDAIWDRLKEYGSASQEAFEQRFFEGVGCE